MYNTCYHYFVLVELCDAFGFLLGYRSSEDQVGLGSGLCGDGDAGCLDYGDENSGTCEREYHGDNLIVDEYDWYLGDKYKSWLWSWWSSSWRWWFLTGREPGGN